MQNNRILRNLFNIGIFAGLLFAGCGGDKSKPAVQADKPVKPRQNIELKIAIEQAGEYLVRVCKPNGRFIYSQSINATRPPSKSYNMLRHLGTIYSLCEYYKWNHRQSTMDAILRATDYFKKNSLGPVEGHENMLAAWSRPEVVGKSHSRRMTSAKLGGAGLALIALTTLEEIKPGTTSHEDLNKIANFVIFMQKADGGYYSLYIPSRNGKDDTWTSLYYPGEAAFGLKKVYSLTGYEPARQSADKALMFLARTREGEFPLPPDHWALIATGWDFAQHNKKFDLADPINVHAIMVARSIIHDMAKDIPADSPEYGCFNSYGLTCPTSARSEGLIAMMSMLPEGHPLRTEIRGILDRAIKFLIRSQVRIGDFSGAIPRVIRVRKDIPAEKLPKNFNKRADEVRIDYVQHALCAMIEYEKLLN